VKADRIAQDPISDLIEATSSEFISVKTEANKRQADRLERYNGICKEILVFLSNAETENFFETLCEYPVTYPEIECIYILDSQGIQISDTVVNKHMPRRSTSRIFQPDEKLSDQSCKDYFFYIKNGSDRYISDPYISSATGNMCITISRSYNDSSGNMRILCIDLI
jgi:hypothetical protein